MKRHPHARCPGFGLPAAVFLLVILAGLAAALAKLGSGQQQASGLDIQGARALQAARAGIEWGLFQVLDLNPASVRYPGTDPDGAPPWDNAYMPPCFASPTSLVLGDFSVSVLCTSTDYLEGTRQVRIYRLDATASLGTPGSPGRVERAMGSTVEMCKTPAGSAPLYLCS
jgi:MSHA biogenesis protein MshP